MNLELPEDGDYDTIGGLVFSELGRVPQAGEAVVWQDKVRISVLEATRRRIDRVRIERLERTASARAREQRIGDRRWSASATHGSPLLAAARRLDCAYGLSAASALDRLLAGALLFARAFCPGSDCAPRSARAAPASSSRLPPHACAANCSSAGFAVAVAGVGLRGARTCRRPLPGDRQAAAARRRGGRSTRKKAVFVPGNGYQVAGVDGYFDEKGRPINCPRRQGRRQDGRRRRPAGRRRLHKGVNGIKEQVGLGPDQTEAQLQFELGEASSAPSSTTRRPSTSSAAAEGWPDSPLEQDALFQLGESYFFAERYPKANNAYEELLRKYPNSPHLDKVDHAAVLPSPAIGSSTPTTTPIGSITPNLIATRACRCSTRSAGR